MSLEFLQVKTWRLLTHPMWFSFFVVIENYELLFINILPIKWEICKRQYWHLQSICIFYKCFFFFLNHRWSILQYQSRNLEIMSLVQYSLVCRCFIIYFEGEQRIQNTSKDFNIVPRSSFQVLHCFNGILEWELLAHWNVA